MIHAIMLNSLAATLICCAGSPVFYYVWFLKFSWDVHRIPMGMSIIAYPIFFSLPIILLAGGYELALPSLAQWLHHPGIAASFAGRVGFPCVAIRVLLCLFAPMDTNESYIAVLFRRL